MQDSINSTRTTTLSDCIVSHNHCYTSSVFASPIIFFSFSPLLLFIICNSLLLMQHHSQALPQCTQCAKVSIDSTRTPNPSEKNAQILCSLFCPWLNLLPVVVRPSSTLILNTTSTSTTISSNLFIFRWKIILGCMLLLSQGLWELQPPTIRFLWWRP